MDAAEEIDSAIGKNLTQRLFGCFDRLFQFGQSRLRAIFGPMDEVNGTMLVVVSVFDTGCGGTLVEPSGHNTIFHQNGDRFLQHRLASVNVVTDIGRWTEQPKGF